MERLIGRKVCHKDLGEGLIKNAKDTDNGIIITVEFPTETKRYGFPVAIGKALSCDDMEVLAMADELIKAKEEACRREEEERKAAEGRSFKEKSDWVLAEATKIIRQVDKNTDFGEVGPGMFRIFKVHQGRTFQEEFMGGYVWAPESGIHHHERLTEIHPGDIIFHYANGALAAVGEAVSKCFECPQPAALYGHGWGTVGYRVEIRSHRLSAPYSLFPHKMDILARKHGRYSSFDNNADACQGYMYELEYDLAKIFKNGILSTRQPVGVKNVLNRIR